MKTERGRETHPRMGEGDGRSSHRAAQRSSWDAVCTAEGLLLYMTWEKGETRPKRGGAARGLGCDVLLLPWLWSSGLPLVGRWLDRWVDLDGLFAGL